jgi:hypothetical protein
MSSAQVCIASFDFGTSCLMQHMHIMLQCLPPFVYVGKIFRLCPGMRHAEFSLVLASCQVAYIRNLPVMCTYDQPCQVECTTVRLSG